MKASARKDEARKDAAQKERAQKEASQKGEARKDATRKARAQKRASSKKRDPQESAQADRAQKEQDDQHEVRRTASQPPADNETLAALRQKLRELRKRLRDMESVRAELAAIKAQIRGSAPKPTIWGGVPLTLPPSLSAPPSGSPGIELASVRIPHAREVDPPPLLPPVDPATDSLRAVIREELRAAPPPELAVEEAKSYLVQTAMPGYTMMRQGVSVAIDRLHPGFAVKLAEAVRRARAEGMTQAGVFSAYRPPAFGIGGFRDKFDSLHSYGLATDITGIGRPGSASARRWHEIVVEVGLHLPYGPDHRVEFNHTQLIPAKVAPMELRETITADGPKDLRAMWLASGVDAYLTEPPAVAVAGGLPDEPSADAGEPTPVASMQGE